MTAEELIGHLELVRPNSNGWMAKCPAHDDLNPSLSIQVGADGRTLLKCHAGCAAADIVKALGLHMRDLFVPRGPKPVTRRGRSLCR